jgi:hypothetical protein
LVTYTPVFPGADIHTAAVAVAAAERAEKMELLLDDLCYSTKNPTLALSSPEFD